MSGLRAMSVPSSRAAARAGRHHRSCAPLCPPILPAGRELRAVTPSLGSLTPLHPARTSPPPGTRYYVLQCILKHDRHYFSDLSSFPLISVAFCFPSKHQSSLKPSLIVTKFEGAGEDLTGFAGEMWEMVAAYLSTG